MIEESLDSNTTSGLNTDRYFGLMCYSAVELTITFPLGLYSLLSNGLNGTVFPWISWEDTQYDFDRVDQLPASYLTAEPAANFQFGVNILRPLRLLRLLRSQTRADQPVPALVLLPSQALRRKAHCPEQKLLHRPDATSNGPSPGLTRSHGPIGDAKYHPDNNVLPASPYVVVNSLIANDDDRIIEVGVDRDGYGAKGAPRRSSRVSSCSALRCWTLAEVW